MKIEIEETETQTANKIDFNVIRVFVFLHVGLVFGLVFNMIKTETLPVHYGYGFLLVSVAAGFAAVRSIEKIQNFVGMLFSICDGFSSIVKSQREAIDKLRGDNGTKM
jgi:hypothetical protein